MKIIRLVPEERKIGLSIRALKDQEYRANWEAYTETTGRPEVTLGNNYNIIGLAIRVPGSEALTLGTRTSGAWSLGTLIRHGSYDEG